MKRLAPLIVMCAATWPTLAHADLPSWLRKKNGDITDGNELLSKGDAKGALAAYDKAARELPDNPGVQLDRGLALLKLGEFAKAKEALLSATGPSGSTDTRADAYRNLSLTYYREADALAAQSKHEEAQKLFRDAGDAAKRSLRLRPGDPSTAWNLELAARRVREEEAKQKEEQDKQKQDPKDKQDGQDQQKQDGQDGESGDQKDDPSAQNDAQKKPEDPKDTQDGKDQAKKPPEQDKDKAASDAQKEAQAKKEAEKKAAQQAQEAENGKDGKDDKAASDKPLPAEVSHALDALQDGEENFERVRARQRAQQERRAPDKDW